MLRFRFTLQVLCQLVLSSCLIAAATAQAQTAGTASPPANSIDRQFGSGWDARGVINALQMPVISLQCQKTPTWMHQSGFTRERSSN